MKTKIQIKYIIPLTVIVSLFLLNGCSDKKEEKKETFKTVQYYDTHKEIRDSRLKECKTMEEMTEMIMIDCEHANTSYSNESRGKPLNW